MGLEDGSWVNVFTTIRQVYELTEKFATSISKSKHVCLKMSLVWRWPGPSDSVREGKITRVKTARRWTISIRGYYWLSHGIKVPAVGKQPEVGPWSETVSFSTLYWMFRVPNLLMLAVLLLLVLSFGSFIQGDILLDSQSGAPAHAQLPQFVLDVDRPWLTLSPV